MGLVQRIAAEDSGVRAWDGNVAPEAVHMQLERLRAAAFAGSEKLFRFLSFVVAEALAGRAGTLKELVIGVELYGGGVDYDPRIDSAVRVEARRLRRKLAAYYAGPGCRDEVVISIPTGGYAPRFEQREPRTIAAAASPVTPPMLAVLPFTALCAQEKAFAAGVTDEIIYAAERGSDFRVASRAIMFQFHGGRYSLDEVARHASSDLFLHGTIRRAREVCRVSVELSGSCGQILWSDRIDIIGDADLDVQEHMAGVILERLRQRTSCTAMP